jgi:hypothetical protein
MDRLEALRALADRWDFCLVMAAVGLAAALWSWRWRKHPAALALPAFGFLGRKLLLFVPVCGAVSTSDQVVYWSPGAYIYYLLLMLSFSLLSLQREVVFGLRHLTMASGVILWLLGSVLLLPVDGWCHLTMPLVCWLGVPKLMLVSPALVWACWLGLALQIAAVPFGRLGLGRLLNTVVLAVVLMVGLGSFIAQVVIVAVWKAPAECVQVLQQAPYRRPSSSERTKTATVGGAVTTTFDFGETEYFPSSWLDLLTTIERTGVNLVEKVVPASGNLVLPPTDAVPRESGPGLVLAVIIVGLLPLAVMSERAGRAVSTIVAAEARSDPHSTSLAAPDPEHSAPDRVSAPADQPDHEHIAPDSDSAAADQPDHEHIAPDIASGLADQTEPDAASNALPRTWPAILLELSLIYSIIVIYILAIYDRFQHL